MAVCVNLRDRFGDMYKVAYEEAYHAQYGANAHREDPWLQVIPCKYGHFYPFGGRRLAVSVDGHPGIAKRILGLACCDVLHDGDFGECTATFDVDAFADVAAVMRPRKRRRLSDAHKAKLLAASQHYRFNGSKGCKNGARTRSNGDQGNASRKSQGRVCDAIVLTYNPKDE